MRLLLPLQVVTQHGYLVEFASEHRFLTHQLYVLFLKQIVLVIQVSLHVSDPLQFIRQFCYFAFIVGWHIARHFPQLAINLLELEPPVGVHAYIWIIDMIVDQLFTNNIIATCPVSSALPITIDEKSLLRRHKAQTRAFIRRIHWVASLFHVKYLHSSFVFLPLAPENSHFIHSWGPCQNWAFVVTAMLHMAYPKQAE